MSSGPTHYDAFNFLVTIDGVPVAAFSECVLPAATIEPVEYREGNDEMDNVHKLPGLVSFGNLILRRGIPSPPTTLAIWDWFSGFVIGKGTPKSIKVTLLDSSKAPVIEWTFNNCWPVKYESPVLNGKTSALAIETLEIAVDSMMLSGMSQSG